MNYGVLYPMIFKRKSFHLFRNCGDLSITEQEQDEIIRKYREFSALHPEIRTAIRIVPSPDTTCKRGQEFCILFYSEKKANYLANIGYIGQQLDLYLVSKNIGTLWFGIGRVTQQQQHEGLDFVVMIAIRKIDDVSKFRKDMYKSKRKTIDEIWQGEVIPGVSDLVRFAPSACNTQPWLVRHENNTLSVYRYKKAGKRGIMPANMISYYNQIDIGIFLCYLELCLSHEKISYSKKMYVDDGSDSEETLIAVYSLSVGG